VKVLVVDDEDDARELLLQVFVSAGADVLAAASSREAIDHFRRSSPDILLCDIALPDEDGYAVIRTIRALAREQGRTIRAAALTAYTREKDASRALEAGFDIHVPKPIEPFELVAIVAALARRER
jgi:CheY-like chemotaxis protein